VSTARLAPGVTLFAGALDRAAQGALAASILEGARAAPFYTPRMPRSGAAMSVLQTSFGALGWVTDKAGGYRYQPLHPETGRAWPALPASLLALWRAHTDYRAPPDSCLVNLYRGQARMGLHVDADEAARDAPVVSVSLGDDAIFRFGGVSRSARTRTVKLGSGDVLTLAGPARDCFHGIDRVVSGSSALIAGGGRINLTLRRVTLPPDA